MAKAAAGKRGSLAQIARDVATLVKSVRRLKDMLTGAKWRRAHRIESELETLAGTKPPMRGRAKGTGLASGRSVGARTTKGTGLASKKGKR